MIIICDSHITTTKLFPYILLEKMFSIGTCIGGPVGTVVGEAIGGAAGSIAGSIISDKFINKD